MSDLKRKSQRRCAELTGIDGEVEFAESEAWWQGATALRPATAKNQLYQRGEVARGKSKTGGRVGKL